MITKKDAMTCSVFYHIFHKNRDGSPKQCRANGACKTWKTRPAEFRLPVVHGLRDYFYICPRNAREWRTTPEPQGLFDRERCYGRGGLFRRKFLTPAGAKLVQFVEDKLGQRARTVAANAKEIWLKFDIGVGSTLNKVDFNILSDWMLENGLQQPRITFMEGSGHRGRWRYRTTYAKVHFEG